MKVKKKRDLKVGVLSLPVEHDGCEKGREKYQFGFLKVITKIS